MSDPHSRREQALYYGKVGVLAVFLCVWLSSSAVAIEPGRSAPDVTLTIVQGEDTRTRRAVADYRRQTLVLEFWATWCGPCIQSLEHWNALVQKMSHDGINFVAVTDESADAVIRFLRTRSINGVVAIDSAGTAFESYGIDARPRAVVLDRKGTVRWVGHTNDLSESIIRAVDRKDPIPKSSRQIFAEKRSTAPTLFETSLRPSVSSEFAMAAGPDGLEIRSLTVEHMLATLMMVSVARLTFEEPIDDIRYDLRVVRGKAAEDPRRLAVRGVEAAFGWEIARERRRREVFVLRRGDFRDMPVDAASTMVTTSPSTIEGVGTVPDLVIGLEGVLRQPIVDETGLTGTFRWDVRWDDSDNRSVLDAIRDLGFSVSWETADVDLVVVRRRSDTENERESLTSAAGEPTRGTIAMVDRDALTTRIFPDARRSVDVPVFYGNVVIQVYGRSQGKPSVEVALGIFPDAEAASRALRRSEPSLVRLLKSAIGDEHFLSSRFLNSRFDNTVAWIEVDDLASGETVDGVADALSKAFADPSIVKRGGAVNTPTIAISSWEQVRGDNYRVVFASDADLALGTAAPRSETGTREVVGGKGWRDSEFVLRVARLTGEIAELPASRFPATARKVRGAEEKTPLPRETRRKLLDTLEDNRVGPIERARAMFALAQGATEEELPAIMGYLNSDDNPIVREHALQAIARIVGSGALSTYRDVARADGQPEVARRDAVRLIGEYGGTEDAKFLRELAENTTDIAELQVALREALRSIEGLPVRD